MNSLKNSILNHPYKLEIYSKINPRLFDVSLRDGIQNAIPCHYPTHHKKTIMEKIWREYRPHSVEVGSLVSPKLLPILADSKEMYEYTNELKKTNHSYQNINIFMLVPSLSKLVTATNMGITNLSFIASVSNPFQLKNTNKNVVDTMAELLKISEFLQEQPNNDVYYKKLYISCINHCPISGKINTFAVTNKILMYYHLLDFEEFCLSDTCGKLEYTDFVTIVEGLFSQGVCPSKISMHLHVTQYNIQSVEKILRYCFENRISKFDVSSIETGGCSVTIKGGEELPNLTYDLFYKVLHEYIESKLELEK
jgi:isopropylmalate/homocitrate/citramalate synthase